MQAQKKSALRQNFEFFLSELRNALIHKPFVYFVYFVVNNSGY